MWTPTLHLGTTVDFLFLLLWGQCADAFVLLYPTLKQQKAQVALPGWLIASVLF